MNTLTVPSIDALKLQTTPLSAIRPALQHKWASYIPRFQFKKRGRATRSTPQFYAAVSELTL
jgi:hypothetical protein